MGWAFYLNHWRDWVTVASAQLLMPYCNLSVCYVSKLWWIQSAAWSILSIMTIIRENLQNVSNSSFSLFFLWEGESYMHTINPFVSIWRYITSNGPLLNSAYWRYLMSKRKFFCSTFLAIFHIYVLFTNIHGSGQKFRLLQKKRNKI